MATNPMQRQARNSFLLGMVVTLLIAAIIVALLFMQIKKLNEKIKADEAATKSVYVLNKDIKSGQVITADLFSLKTVKADGVPANATSDITTLLQNYSLCDKAGNDIYTDSEGNLFMNAENGSKVTVNKDDTTGNYYTQAANGTKTYIETTEKPLVAKIDMKANTVLASSFIARSDDIDTADVRQQEYNSFVLPVDLFTGDYVDIRLLLPSGQDYIVTSKKMVTVPDVDGEYLADTVQMKMSEDEILTMSNAIVDAYRIEGAKLYATKYTDAGSQDASTPTYVVNDEVAKLIEADPNIVSTAMSALSARYNANNGALKTMRSQGINSALSNYGKDENVPDKVEESITSTKEARQQYLQSLTGGASTSSSSSSTSSSSSSSN